MKLKNASRSLIQTGDDMKEIKLTKIERTTLLYLESCAVDKCGRVESRRMNEDDYEAITNMKTLGLIEAFQRMPFSEVERFSKMASVNVGLPTHYVILSVAGFAMAARCRYDRAMAHKPSSTVEAKK